MLPFLPLESEIGNIPVNVVLNVLLGLPWMERWANGREPSCDALSLALCLFLKSESWRREQIKQHAENTVMIFPQQMQWFPNRSEKQNAAERLQDVAINVITLRKPLCIPPIIILSRENDKQHWFCPILINLLLPQHCLVTNMFIVWLFWNGRCYVTLWK